MPILPKNSRTFFLAILAFAICSIAAAARSRGFIESDGATHYVFARHAFEQPMFFVDIWGRPLCTALFAVPASLGGLIAVRMTSLLAAIGCALVAAQIARGQGYPRPVLALIFTLGQPLLFLHSFSELTELPFALVLGLAFIGYQRRRWWAMAILAAVAPLGRPEGFAFLFLAAVALVAHRKWLPLLILPAGLFAWSIAGHHLVGPADRPWWRWLIDHWPYEQGSEYPRGPIVYFLATLPVVVGPFALPAMWIGMWQGLRSARPAAGLKEHHRRVDFLIAALPLAILIGHSLLHWLGKLSSSGSPRYLLIVAPLWGCLSARGWEWAFSRFSWPRPISWAALAVVTPGLVNCCYPFLPVKQSANWSQAQKLVQWYEHTRLSSRYPRIMTNHPGIFFYLNASPWDRARVEPWSPDAIDHPPAGVLLLWDREFCTQNSDPILVAPLWRVEQAGWIDDPSSTSLSDANNPDVPPNQLRFDKSDVWEILRSPLDATSERKAKPPLRKAKPPRPPPRTP
ncbi:MAG: hypothetical protein ABSB42_03080 [Tepidisphaeraceae bacterium]